jgi:hypothetical protein
MRMPDVQEAGTGINPPNVGRTTWWKSEVCRFLRVITVLYQSRSSADRLPIHDHYQSAHL